MNRELTVAARRIGRGYPCFIIAEVGVNHNGQVDLARKLIDAAAGAGADAVKFQTWITERLITRDAPLADYQIGSSRGEKTQYAMLKELELSFDDFRELKHHADGAGILFFSTPDEEQSADFLDDLGQPLFKIGSGEITNEPFLRHVAEKKKPTILSTGMSTLGEVEKAVEVFRRAENLDLALLHCLSNYPALPSECNLRAMLTLEKAFDCVVGFSDHTMEPEIAVAAVAMGARIIEKHITLDRQLPGPDHKASFDVPQFASLVASIRRVEGAMGDGVKRPMPSEMRIKSVVQKSIVLLRDIDAGAVLKAGDVALRRSSGGLSPSYLSLVIGRRLRTPLKADMPVPLEALE